VIIRFPAMNTSGWRALLVDSGLAKGKLRPILSNTGIFGSDLYEVGLGEKIEGYFEELIAGPRAVRNTLMKYTR
jgi:fructuronate reductase